MMKDISTKVLSRRTKLQLLFAASALCLCALLVSSFRVFTIQKEQRAALNEYDSLRTQFTASEHDDTAQKYAELSAINADYAGWIELPGTVIDYPIVQTTDNDTYLHHTFEGTENPAGAIFLDCRNAPDFSSQHTIIYGHMMKNGSMFGNLQFYLDPEFMAQHPTIYITTQDGTQHHYRIFAVQMVKANDSCYQVTFADETAFTAFAQSIGAQDTRPLLTLSTCTPKGSYDERIVIHAVLEET